MFSGVRKRTSRPLSSDTSDVVFAENPVNSGNHAGCGPLEIGARTFLECVLVPRTQPNLRQLAFSLGWHTRSARSRIKIGTFETFDSPTVSPPRAKSSKHEGDLHPWIFGFELPDLK
jgi:hypothetical protein